MKIDIEYAVHRLYKQYGGRRGFDGQHPEYLVQAWHKAVERMGTQLGYWEWVVVQFLIEDLEEDDSLEQELQSALLPLEFWTLQANEDDAKTLARAGILPSPDRYTGEHADYPWQEWIDDVLLDDVRLGYWTCLAVRLEYAAESDDEEEDHTPYKSDEQGRPLH